MYSERAKVLIVNVSDAIPAVLKSIREHRPQHVVFICSELTKLKVNGSGDVCIAQGTCRHCRHAFETAVGPSCAQKVRSLECLGCHAPLGAAQTEVEKQSTLAQAAHYGVPFDNKRNKWAVIITTNVMDLDCYMKAVDAAYAAAYAMALRESDRADIIADYTGRTKSMTLALGYKALTAHRNSTELYSVSTQPAGIGTHDVVPGTEETAPQYSDRLCAEAIWREALELANAHSYASARSLLESVPAAAQDPPIPALRARIALLRRLCGGLDLWDRFEFAAARATLGDLPELERSSEGQALLQGLDTLAAPLPELDASVPLPRHHRWPDQAMYPVYDLLNNAQRRATQARHNDALIRLNAAITRIAQNRLRFYYGIDIGHVDPQWFPDAAAWEQRLTKLGDRYATSGEKMCYPKLRDLKDPLGKAYSSRGIAGEVVQLRNRSYLEHGRGPMGPNDYQVAWRCASDFLRTAAQISLNQELPPPLLQFPSLREGVFESPVAQPEVAREAAHPR